MARTLNLRIWRGDAKDGGLKDVQVDVNEGEVVLDVIHRVQATQMGDLAVRWNCKAGKCGSCSMEINGKPRLACMTQVASFDENETITVTPLRAFPVIKDLVTDVSFNYKKAMEIPAYEPPKDLAPGASTHATSRCRAQSRVPSSASSASYAKTLATSFATTKRTSHLLLAHDSLSVLQN